MASNLLNLKVSLLVELRKKSPDDLSNAEVDMIFAIGQDADVQQLIEEATRITQRRRAK